MTMNVSRDRVGERMLSLRRVVRPLAIHLRTVKYTPRLAADDPTLELPLELHRPTAGTVVSTYLSCTYCVRGSTCVVATCVACRDFVTCECVAVSQKTKVLLYHYDDRGSAPAPPGP